MFTIYHSFGKKKENKRDRIYSHAFLRDRFILFYFIFGEGNLPW